MKNPKNKFSLLLLIVFFCFTTCKKKTDAANEETTDPPASVYKPDYRDSVTGKYLTSFTVTFNNSTFNYTDTVIVRKPNPTETPFYDKSHSLDSSITLQLIPRPCNCSNLHSKETFCHKLGKNLSGSTLLNSFISLQNRSLVFKYPDGVNPCGSIGCGSKGTGFKLP